MMDRYSRSSYFVVMVTTLLFAFSRSAYGDQEGTTYREPDLLDFTLEKMRNVTGSNCYLKPRWELQLSKDMIAQIPLYPDILSSRISANRSVLAHLHSLAFSKALYYSFVYGQFNLSKFYNYEPSIINFYMSSAAEVSAGADWIHGSAIWFDNNSSYPNWDSTVYFNRTLPLFGIRAWKRDRYKEPINLFREPAQQSVDGHVFTEDFETNYTDPRYNYCPYTSYSYDFWWPDDRSDIRKSSIYTIGLRESKTTGSFSSGDFRGQNFYGPPVAYQFQVPVVLSRPYFDCGRSNKWIVSMAAPVVEFMTRYHLWNFLRRPKVTAMVGKDIEFDKLDINPCPLSEGNPQPNLFAGIARCRSTTVCEPLNGFGLQRGGYQCVCRKGLYYPWGQNGPFQGVDIEQSTEEQYTNGTFDCITPEELSQYAGGSLPNVTAEPHEVFNEYNWVRAKSIIQQFGMITRETCTKSHDAGQLHLPYEAVAGIETHFEAQARTALKTAHYLSNFLQNAGELRDILATVGEYIVFQAEAQEIHLRLNETHIYGEVLANAMSDPSIAGFGVFFDRNKFKTGESTSREFFGPFAYREAPPHKSSVDGYKVVDFAGFHTRYVDEDWFRLMKGKWNLGLDSLEQFRDRLVHHTRILSYRAPVYTDGEWSQPRFKCDGRVMDWVVTYTAAFFGPNGVASEIEFKGVVLVDVKLSSLDINQCPTLEHGGAFKSTAKCHYDSQYCVPISGRGYTLGAYECECRQGYVNPLYPDIQRFDAETMEEEYQSTNGGESPRNTTLRCAKVEITPVTHVTTTSRDASGSPPLLVNMSFIKVLIILLVVSTKLVTTI